MEVQERAGMFLLAKLKNMRSFLNGTERWADSWERLIPVTMALILVLMVVMAFTSDLDRHPDEYQHCAAAKYYLNHWLPPPVGDWDTVDSY